MFFSKSLILAFLTSSATAAGVVGKPTGFAAATTGGGSAKPIYPRNLRELKTFLTDDQPRVIMLDHEFNFIGSEGKVTQQGCRPSSNKCPGKGGQDAINGANWCNGQPAVSVTYDKAGTGYIDVKSNKSIVGVGKAGVIRGKGLRIANGAKNVIIQNVHITELNPQYIWGGDAITLAGTDLIWIDHVKISLIGRQHIVAGYAASNRVTISNTEFDGSTSWSASCDNHHYWALLLIGSGDKITFQGNYIHHTSGRSPKVGGTGSGTLLHAVNNLWVDNTGHAFSIAENENGRVIAEGNVMQTVKSPILDGAKFLFSAPNTSTNAACKTPLGHVCEVNSLTGSGAFSGSLTSISNFSGGNVAVVAASKVAQSVKANAGVGKSGF